MPKLMLFPHHHLQSSKLCKAGCIDSLWLQYGMIQFSDLRTTWIYLLVLEVRSIKWFHWATSGAGRAMLLPQVLGVNLFPCLFQVLEVVYISWVVSPSFIFKDRKVAHLNLHFSDFDFSASPSQGPL